MLIGIAAVAGLLGLNGTIVTVDALAGGTRLLNMSGALSVVILMSSLAVGVQFHEGLSLSPSRSLLASGGAATVLTLWSLFELSTGWGMGMDVLVAAGTAAPHPEVSAVSTLPFLSALLLAGATVLAGHPMRYTTTQALALGAVGLALLEWVHLVVTPGDRLGGSGAAAVVFMTLPVALLLSQPDRGVMRTIGDDGPIGTAVRRLMPLALVPVVCGWLIWQGVGAGLYPASFGAALFATVAALSTGGLILSIGRMNVAAATPRTLTDTSTRSDTAVHPLQRALSDAPVPLLVHDGDTIIEMNRAWSDIAGLGTADAPTITAWLSQVQPSKLSELPVFQERWAGTVGTMSDGDLAIPSASGAPRLWTLTTTPLGPVDARPRLFVTVAADVTLQRESESSLRRTHSDLETRFTERAAALTSANDALKRQSDQLREQTLLLDLVREGILVRDLYGTIVYWNHGASTMYGWPKDHALGKVSHTLLGAEYPMAVADIEKEVMRTGFWEGDVVHVTRSGTRLLVESRWTLTRTERGSPEGFLEVHRDITQRRQAERALQAKAEALARSNHELEQFAYVASHDLQEPLRMVSNYTQLLANRYRDRLDSDANEFIDFAVDGAKRMQDLIHDLLQYARVERRGREFRPVPTDTIVADALSNLAGAIAEARASVVIDSLPTLTCDSSQLTQVFQNLIGNAIKFRKADTPPVVKVSATREAHGWRVSVADNGIGIEPRFFERIFQMFQRLHARGEYSGTGIGLALCKKIVERHGGQMRVESALGHGTTFSFTMPDPPSAG